MKTIARFVYLALPGRLLEKSGQMVLLWLAIGLAGCATPYSMVQNGQTDALRAYLEQGGNPNTFTKGMTGLHEAAKRGHIEAARELLDAGADVNARTSQTKMTPLYLSAFFGKTDAVKLLLAGGANPDLPNINGATPLYVAAQGGHNDIVGILLAAQANPDVMHKGWAPLHIAAYKNQAEAIRQIAAHVDIDLINANGDTALYLAARHGHVDALHALLAGGADINKANPKQYSPLYIAATHGHLQIVNALIAAGADINQPNATGTTPLIIALYNQKEEVVKTLLLAGAEVNVRDQNDRTPLLLASWLGDTGSMELLLRHGADPTVRTKKGETVEQRFNRKALDKQRAAQQQRQQKQQQQNSFQWGKFAALTAGATLGGLSQVDSDTQLKVMSAITQDSLAGNNGMSNVQALASGSRASGGVSGASGAGAVASCSYPARPDILRGHPACTGYTVESYKEYYEANRRSDTQLHTHCASAYNYYSMYLNAIRQGYSQQDSDITYRAYENSAKVAMEFYRQTR